MREHVEEAGSPEVAGAPQEAAADVPQLRAATDNWWEDVSEMQAPRELHVYVPISTVTGKLCNVQFSSSTSPEICSKK